ncbi:MAG: glycosyltransferase [Desulfobacula sp.]|nr:glycosyltransferase [Desulfobacula sp.]
MLNLQIHQLVPSLNYGDAIGNDVLEIRTILQKWGYKSDIYVQFVDPKLSKIAKKFKKFKKVSSSENILIFHFATGSDLSEFIKTCPDKKIIIYHNITPYSYFIGINDSVADTLMKAKNEIKGLAEVADLALGVSKYNQKELIELGFKNTGVLPIIVDFRKYNQAPDQIILNKFENDYTNFIFVGRLAPNKKQEDIIKCFYYYNKSINSKSRLFLVGSYNSTEKYHVQLHELVERLNLKENVYIVGHVSFEELLAYYKLADIFISMSEHEGFCVPLLESMYFEIPIIAFNSTAIPQTLNGAGVLVNKKRYKEVAELAHIIVKDEKLRDIIIRSQRAQLEQFEKTNVETMLNDYIKKVMS